MTELVHGKRKLSDAGSPVQSRFSSPSASPSPPPPYEKSSVNVESAVPHFGTRSNSPDLRVHSNKRNNRANDQDLVSAAEALTQLTRSATPPTLSSANSPLPEDVTMSSESEQHPLITKVTQHPLVTNAVKYYESSKRNYASFNYAAEIVEKAAIPVVKHVEGNLNSMHQARQKKIASGSSTPSLSAVSSHTGLNSENGKKKRRRVSNASGDPNTNVTIETKKRIQFCLHILRLANDNITSKVQFLQQKVQDREKSLQEEREKLQQQQSQQADPAVQAEAAQQTKTEIVTTVKKIIHLISNFRPSSLSTEGLTPTPTHSEDNDLKNSIRDIILTLPNAIQQIGVTNTTTGQQGNDRVVLFAKESLDMISKLTKVFNDQLIKAESWVGGEEETIQEDGAVLAKFDSQSTQSSKESSTTLKEETTNDLAKSKEKY
ncbi:uncharacterized protein RJT20DRAFT_125986 [Scheffersomyces xylosifermentans]|uniref:uncharacterized protein n=1 Tax=Scheffersomyces xylosifermentans TaxID=1304137 RepID=UPI00315C6171